MRFSHSPRRHFNHAKRLLKSRTVRKVGFAVGLAWAPALVAAPAWEATAAYRVDQTQQRPYRREESSAAARASSTTSVNYSRIELTGLGNAEAQWQLRVNPAAEMQKEQCLEDANGNVKRQTACGQRLVESGEVQVSPWGKDRWAISAGIMNVEIGGWELDQTNEEELFPGDYLTSIMPFSRQQPALALHTTGVRNFGVQVTNDTTTAFGENGQFSSQRTQPVPVWFWSDSFGGIKPKVQLAPYDQNKSLLLCLGILVDPKSAPVGLSVDSTIDRRVFRLPDLDSPGEYRRKAGIFMSYVLDLRVDLTDQLRLLHKTSLVKLFDCRCTKGALPEVDLKKSWMVGLSYSLMGEAVRAFTAVGSLDGKAGAREEISAWENGVEATTFRMGLMGRL